jgi:glyoxylase-like metal-dependent hydrolase (beta-lactamase superfamily II)
VIKVAPRKTGLELTFLGTRGEIKIRSRPHQRHSSLLVEHDGARIMIDCGTDWLGRLTAVAPTAIVLTHAHPDHAGGLAQGAPCPVYATRETLRLVRDRRSMPLKKSVAIGGLRFKAYRVQHSIRAPAVGYRVFDQGRLLLLRAGRCRASKRRGSVRRSRRLYRRWRDDATFDGAR